MNAAQEIELENIRGWLSTRCGIHYPDKKRELLIQRLSRVQRAFNIDSIADLGQRIRSGSDGEIELAVMHAASTNHTYFFRELDTLDQFRNMILPTLQGKPEIRIWSAACSTGDEAYTIAILIAEALGDAGLARTSILGTDISQPVVQRAEAGVFGERQIERVPDYIRRKYFSPIGVGQFQIVKKIRDRCTFRRLNLKVQPYPFRNKFQVVFCRNVLYYFDIPDQKATLEAIHNVTEDGGWLVTSVTERVRDLGTPWKTISSGLSRKGNV
ncbi:MAG: protein-glutamate O-methyltransferase CheR [Marivivens sp.]|nr:protein-glutamate O-methyltransferase CheR [Marivivens sp.]